MSQDKKQFQFIPPNVTMHVEGMMCQNSCGSTVENVLKTVPNVVHVQARYARSDALIWGNDINTEKLIEALEIVGFSGSIKTKCNPDKCSDIVDENGQHCDITLYFERNSHKITSDPQEITKYLLSIEGVISVVIDSDHSIAYIWGFVDANTLIKSLNLAGYDAFESFKLTQISSKPSQQTAINVQKAETFCSSSSEAKASVIGGDYNDTTHRASAVLQIKGMKSTNSIKEIQNMLKNLSGMIDITISVLEEQALVIYNPTCISPEHMIVQINKNEKYVSKILQINEIIDVVEKEYIFHVLGMSCANCAAKIEKTIKSMTGIRKANVSSVTNKCQVIVNDSIDSVGPRDVIEAVVSLGFQCELDLGQIESSRNTSNELLIWRNLLIISIIFGAPMTLLHLFMTQNMHVMTYMKSSVMLPICHSGLTTGQCIMLALSLPIQIIVGYRYYRGAFLSAITGSFGMDFLVVTGTTITMVYSIISLCFACSSGVPTKHVFLEASGMLLMFVTIGKYMEVYAKGKSTTAMTDLLKLQPRKAMLVKNKSSELINDTNIEELGTIKQSSEHIHEYHDADSLLQGYNCEDIDEIPVELVKKGDILKVLPGSRIPTDGIIISGNTYVDESMITGESIPVRRKKGDFLFGSTVNQNGAIYLKVTKIGADSALAQIVKLVEHAQLNKAPIQAYADYVAGIFTPLVLLFAVLTFLSWSTLAFIHIVPTSWFQEEYGSPILFSMLFSISVVVISCPCALGLATPTAIMVGTSVGAKNGILIKGGNAFETAHKVTAVIFDKTGTLTMGLPSVTDQICLNESLLKNYKITADESDEDVLLRLAAAVESFSQHPIGEAILREANRRNLRLQTLVENSFLSLTGLGVTGELIEGNLYLGNRDFLRYQEIPIPFHIEKSMKTLEVKGKTAVCVALNKDILGVIGISDKVKPEAKTAISHLVNMGIEVWMVSGDNQTTADAIAADLDILSSRVIASAMPLDKVNKVTELQSEGHIVAMIGDGINDSPALAKSDLGIAVGAGTQIAIETADMILVRNNLLDVLVAFDLAKLVFRRVQLNFIFAFIYNVIAIPFAAGIFFPWTHTLLPPQYAGLSMAFSSISVVASSMTLKFYKRPNYLSDVDSRSISNFIRTRYPEHNLKNSLDLSSIIPTFKPKYYVLPTYDHDDEIPSVIKTDLE